MNFRLPACFNASCISARTVVANGDLVIGHPSAAYWIDVGTPALYLQAVTDALDGRGPCRAAKPGREKLRGVSAKPGVGGDELRDGRIEPTRTGEEQARRRVAK